SALSLLTILLYIVVKKILEKGLAERKNNYTSLKNEYEKLVQENTGLKKDNSYLEGLAEETIALYDITKDICKTLDEKEIFDIFKERIKRYVAISDCRFLKLDADLAGYASYTVLPLKIHKSQIGYLVARGIKEKDRDKFHILAQQFLVGARRAFLYHKVQELAITDSLTSVFNRRYFFEKLDEEIKRAKKFKHRFSFLMIDIDHFKSFNDRYGHLVGDAVLREVAGAIKENIRQIDFMGRYGGEELSIVLVETEKDQAEYAAERIRQAVESRRLAVYDEVLEATISIGISMFPDDGNAAASLIDKADQALYLAKQAGRNRVCKINT
ncbi:MAG: GGDEF domain-containing protein, partial [Candidatus Omnitrophica bacterium]|nr:GGDEF domain-containing protein [Candidatus Omnitrophota bacterium]